MVQNFKLRRIYGAIIIGMYVFFVVFSILTEYNVIPVHITGVITDWTVAVNMYFVF